MKLFHSGVLWPETGRKMLHGGRNVKNSCKALNYSMKNDLIMKEYSIYGLLILSVFLNACATTGNKRLQLSKSNCNQQNTYSYSVEDIPKPFNEISLDTILTSRFKPNGLNVAHAIGILDLLSLFVEKKREVKANNSLKN